MRRSNLAFCLAHTPRIAQQLKAASAADRSALEDQIEGLSRESLVAADQLFVILTKRGNAPRRKECRQHLDQAL
jgi:hypothetical protein